MKTHPHIVALTWDVEGRLRSVAGATYTYDGNGERVKKSAGGVTTYYVADGMGRLGAEYGAAPAAAGTRYVTADHLGSTRVVSDQSGVVTARCDYSRFGETLAPTATLGNRDLIGTYGCGDAVTGRGIRTRSGMPKRGWITLGPGICRRGWGGLRARIQAPMLSMASI